MTLTFLLSWLLMPLLAAPNTTTAWQQLPVKALEAALKGYQTLIEQGHLPKGALLALAYLSQPRDRERLYILDPLHQTVLLTTLVAHGKNSGQRYAGSVSNSPRSHQSSAGFYLTRGVYRGKHGTALRLHGIEKGINDNALARGIVLHGTDYVNKALANTRGWIGHSQGCPAVSPDISARLIEQLKEHHCLFVYHPSYKLQTTRLFNTFAP
ncbi:MAG: murein L,D-transpeptidase catalytic domain family protein [Sphingomonadales bacterium]